MTVPPNLELWNTSAGTYSDAVSGGQSEHIKIYLPSLDRMLGDISGKTILDAGCGDGYYAFRLAQKGAGVYAVDGSAEMIRLAGQRYSHRAILYRQFDLTGPMPFEDEIFDAAVANMVLMDMNHIDTVVGEIARTLKSQGIFVFSLTHPCFFLSDWIPDEKGRRQYKAVYDYLGEQVEELDFWGKTLHFHRPLSFYFAALERHGLCVCSLKEPKPPEEEKCADNEHHFRIPSFLVIKAIKQGGAR